VAEEEEEEEVVRSRDASGKTTGLPAVTHAGSSNRGSWTPFVQATWLPSLAERTSTASSSSSSSSSSATTAPDFVLPEVFPDNRGRLFFTGCFLGRVGGATL
jgi:hypothetical protein